VDARKSSLHQILSSSSSTSVTESFVQFFRLIPILDVDSFTSDAAPSVPPYPALKPVRALDNAPAQGARTGRPRR
jgi:hypothetical protein